MKTTPLVRSLIVALLSLAMPTAAFAAAGVSIEVKNIDLSPKPPKKDPKKKDKGPETEHEVKKLRITLRNVSREELSGVEVKYYYIGKSVGSSSHSVLKEGSKTTDIAANGSVTVEADQASAAYTEAGHKKEGKDKNAKMVRVKASGEKLLGYGVRAFHGGKLIGESYSSDSAKQVLPKP